jgi:AraC family transcriptional regulator
VPVTMGSPRFRTAEATGCTITEAWFPPGTVLPPHTHDRPVFAVMLGGAFESAIARRRLDCPPASVWVEPLAERHANFIGRQGAHVLVVQPDVRAVGNAASAAGGAELFAPFALYFDEVRHLRHAGVAADARRVTAELAIADDLSPLATDGLVQTMLATAARAWAPRRHHPHPPGWLLSAQELLHARFRERLGLAEVAAAVGVSPWHLARTFRAHFRTTLGEYVRRLRVEWAAERIARTEMSLSEVAIAAGFSDQSHLTREFVRCLGVRPGEWRKCQVSGDRCQGGIGTEDPGRPT